MLSETVLITGASRGIGSATALLFAENGYNVIINYNKSEKNAENILNEIKKYNPSAIKYRADVSDKKQVNNMFDECLKKFGKIDVLINNAGIAQTKVFTDITEQDWDNMINTDLKGTFLCSQAAVKSMIENKKGKIINISSIWGITGGSCEVHYSAAKAGVIGFTKALAKELGPSGINVNSIAPGVIKTDMMSCYTDDDLKELTEETAVLRLGNPDDIAQTALFLASKNADFITGQIISPNGGFVI